MGISQRLYTIEVLEDGEWREYVPKAQRYTMTDKARLVALAQIIMPAKATWRIVEMINPKFVPTDDFMKTASERNALMAEGVRLREVNAELLAAAKQVYDSLNARIDRASFSGKPIPVFDGIAELHAAIAKSEAAS